MSKKNLYPNRWSVIIAGLIILSKSDCYRNKDKGTEIGIESQSITIVETVSATGKNSTRNQ
jgi:hypothetical protein